MSLKFSKASSKKDSDKTKYLIVGYIPLLEDTRSFDRKKIQRAVEATPRINIHGVAWFVNEGQSTPALIMDRARDVADHMYYWSEGAPEKWFSFHFKKNGSSYALAVVPNENMSLERFRIGFQLRTGFPFPADASYDLFFMFLNFIGNMPGAGFDRDEIDLYFMDLQEVGRDIKEINPDKVVYAGTLPVVRESSILEDLLNTKTYK